MNAAETRKRANHLGVVLYVPQDEDGIRAKPKSAVTPELAAAIKENRDEIMRDLLLEQANRYIAERYVEGAELHRVEEDFDLVNKAFADGEFGELRQLVRGYVRAALAEIERAKNVRT